MPSGYGSQALALKYLGVPFEHWKICEWAIKSIQAYKDIHFTNNNIDYSQGMMKEWISNWLKQKGISSNYNEPMTRQQIDRLNEKQIRTIYNNIFATHNLVNIQQVKGEDLEIVDTDKYEYIMTYSFPCFVGKTMVLTNNGYKEIKDIKVGDYVLTHKNTYEKVIASKSTGIKETYILKGMCFDEIKCTENHKFYVRKMLRYYPTYENGKRGSVRGFLKSEWVQCKDLDKTYYMGIAINQNSLIPEWNGIDFEWNDGRKSRHKNELSPKLNNKEFWWLIGRYVGDGWHRKQGGIIICCAKEETSEITSVADSLSIHYSIVKEKTVNKIHFSDKELELFVEPFGRGAKNKKIPGFVFDLPINLLRGFIEGYVSADGTYTQGKFKTTSISKMLTYGIAQCVAKAYNTPFSIYKIKTKPRTTIQGREVNQKDFYQLCWKNEKKKQDKAFYEDGYIWFPITSIESTNKKETVYDIEVENNHSFTANGVIAHNCQDLSLAGKGKGMSDTTTRSGMLWEVERILTECHELGNMPQILLMENVPQVHSEDNLPDFNKWKDRLEELGYKNYFQDLIATDFGIPQTRNRCFMISLLGDYSYTFPKHIPLKLKLKDMLEDNVDEKYYLSDKMIEFFTHNEIKQKEKDNGFTFNVSDGNITAKTITTRAGSRMDDNFIKIGNKSLQETLEQNEINETCYIDTYNKRIDKDKSGTITTGVSFRNNTFLAIKNATSKGYLEATDGDGIDISSRMEYHRGNVQKDKIQTLTTSGGNDRGVIENLRIRKLTPRETFRLMGVKDEDFDKVKVNQSDSSLYHLAGDSIVVNVLMAIFNELLKKKGE